MANPCVNVESVLWGADLTQQQQQMAVVWSCGVTGLRCVSQSRRFLLTWSTHGKTGSEGENTGDKICLRATHECLLQAWTCHKEKLQCW